MEPARTSRAVETATNAAGASTLRPLDLCLSDNMDAPWLAEEGCSDS